MRIFICYSKVDKSYCNAVADILSIFYDVWFDLRLFTGDEWWPEILRNLAASQAVVHLVSPESLESIYCRDELAIAQKNDIPIFNVLVNERAIGLIPSDVQKFQYLDLTEEVSYEACKPLFRSLKALENRLLLSGNGGGKVERIPTKPPIPTPHHSSVAQLVGEIAQAMDDGNFDQAVYLLKTAQERGDEPMTIKWAEMLREAETGLQRQIREREASLAVKEVTELVKRKRTRALGRQALAAFKAKYPEYDTSTLDELCAQDEDICVPQPALAGVAHDAQPAPAVAALPRRRQRFTLSMFELLPIPAGSVTVLTENPRDPRGSLIQDTLYVDAFQISKFPITFAQYQAFVNDRHGYGNPKWWDFSPFAQQWRAANPEPARQHHAGETRPRDNVTWYEAMAFCLWLSARMERRIILPKRQQWQRAARGDDMRLYPWGDLFDVQRANTQESEIRRSTPVDRYPDGVGPFGTWDQAGNCWEWCLNATYDDINLKGYIMRAMQGGSYFSGHLRAQIDFKYLVKPEIHNGNIGFRVACLD